MGFHIEIARRSKLIHSDTIVYHHKEQSLFLWELKSMKNVDMESCYCMYDTGKEEQGILLDRRALPPRNVRKRKEN